MRKPVIENIEIIEPPIGELSKQRSSLKKTCLTGCGCVIFLIVGALLALRFFVGTGPSTIKKLPDNFPTAIPVYEKDSIEKITFISGTYKNRSIEIAAFFPKVILSPMLLQLRRETSTSSSGGFIAANRSFWSLLTTPVGDARDTIQIEWKSIDAEPGFIISYYRKELSKENFTISEVEQNGNTLQFSFESGDGISGTLLTETDLEDHPGTDYAALTVNIPPWFKNPPENK
ncbi:MAG: hypothetical protein WC725_00390 [Patescibacteria group bacterium]|jgi:hypothetical protein